MKMLAVILTILAICSTANAGRMLIEGLPATVNTSAGPVRLTFDIVSNGMYCTESLNVWTYTGATLDMATATNHIVPGEIYDDPRNRGWLAEYFYIDTTNVTQPVIWADIAICHMPIEIIGDIITDLGLTIEQGFEGTLEVKVLSENSGVVEDVATIEVYYDPPPRTITVSPYSTADFTTIQAAIDDANDGDTVLVADGIYTGDGNRDIDFHGRAITVISENGPENCIIDCNGLEADPHRGFYFHTDEGLDSVLSGLTITNGYAPPSDLPGEYGWSNGGGIYCYRAGPTIEDCIITDNVAEMFGGGICCSLLQNLALSRSLIADNRATWGGGGISFDADSGTIKNCLIVGNSSTVYGGGVDAYYGDPVTLEACTIAGNSAVWGGGGIYCYDGDFVVRNCILWGDTAAYGPEIASDNTNGMPLFCNVDIYYSDLEGGQAGVFAYYGPWGEGGIFFHEGNSNVDPSFADPGYWDPNGTPDDANDDYWVMGDYHLKSRGGRWDPGRGRWTMDGVTSPCIDAGDPVSPIDLEPFPNGGIVNIGAYAGTAEASRSYADCFPNTAEYEVQYAQWLALGKPDCWCNDYATGNQCYGDAAGDTHARGYIVYTTDFQAICDSWKAKIGDAHLNPCADITHKSHARGYVVYTDDILALSGRWKKRTYDPITDANGLPGDCPLTDAQMGL